MGGASFCGSHPCGGLLDDGNKVICPDNLFTGRKENIYHLMDIFRFESKRDNVTFPLYVEIDEDYGDPEIHPQMEDYWGHGYPIGILSCYDESKRAETLIFDYRRHYNLKIKVAYIPNTYEPNMQSNDGRVVSNIIMQTLQNLPITIYGDGSRRIDGIL